MFKEKSQLPKMISRSLDFFFFVNEFSLRENHDETYTCRIYSRTAVLKFNFPLLPISNFSAALSSEDTPQVIITCHS